MWRATLVVILSCPPLSAQVTARPKAFLNDAQREQIDAICRQFDGEVPGASIAITKDGKLVFSQAYGRAQLEHNVPNTPNTVFHAASVTKQFTAFALVLLAQDGELTLEDDVRKHVPWLHDFGTTITIRHLLNHTSGLRDQWELLMISGYRLDDVLTASHIHRILGAQRELNFAPGSRYLYCNSGYTIAAHIVEKVSGQEFETFCEDRIFAPLGMTRTHMHTNHRQIVPGRAYSYGRRFLGWQKLVLSYANAGATSLFTTAPDLARWQHNFATGQVGGEKAIAELYRRGVLTSGKKLTYALGVVHGEHGGRQTISHGGADAGFRSHVLWFPNEQLGISVLSNVSNANASRVSFRIADVVLGKPEKGPARRRQPANQASPKQPVSEMNLADFLGRYYSPELEVFYEIGKVGSTLGAMHRRHGRIRLRPIAKDEFGARSGFLRRLAFSRKDGKVDGFRLSSGRVLNLRFVRVE